MATDDFREGRGKRVDIEVAGEFEPPRHVVRRARAFELIEEPETLLGKGEWQRLVARGERDGAGSEVLCRFGVFTRQSGAHAPSEFSDRGGFEDPTYGNGDTKRVAQTGRQLGGEE